MQFDIFLSFFFIYIYQDYKLDEDKFETSIIFPIVNKNIDFINFIDTTDLLYLYNYIYFTEFLFTELLNKKYDIKYNYL